MVADQNILHYRLLGKLGAGGMGVVYRALDTRLGRTVALKFLPEALTADPTARERLLVEAQAAAKLDHPNVGTVYAIEETEGGQLFIAMAYYEGKTLEKRLIPLPVHEALDLAVQVARGLAHAHEAEVVHRDVKPANLILTPQGLVKILDFGLARLKEPNGLTQAGMTLGTMEYASPEQVRGQPTDHRTDLWALGVVLYEMLTGVSPFRGGGDAASSILRVLNTDPEPPSALTPELPPATDAVLARLLARDVRARYGSALEVIEDLEAVRGGTAGGTVAPSTVPPSSQPVVTHPGTVPSPSQPAAPVPHNLPKPPTPLVGRQDELALLDLYLGDPDCRIVTLLGLGGTGKTRLSIAAAREQVEKQGFTGGVYFVPLDALSTPDLIPTSIAEALKLELQGSSDPLEQVVAHIGEKHVLLVLDNFEHLVEGAAVASDLVGGCPNLKLLVTSRERLNLLEEWILPLQGLPYPREEVGSLEEARSFGAVELFIQRAKRVKPSFTPTQEDLPHLVAICQLVTGLPLGVELAAVWVRMMPCAEIAREIGHNLDFLTTSVRNVAERHRSIRAVFEGSWNLLEPEEQGVLRKLSVFKGGFTKEAAQEVVGASLEALAGLVDKSLLQTTANGRYDQHPLLYQYAQEKLAERPEEQRQAEESHGTYYLHFLQEQGKEVRGPKQQEALAAIGEELENIRVAWRWAVTNSKGKELKQTAEPLRLFYDQRGRIHEGIEILSQALLNLSDTIPEHHVAFGYTLVNQAYLHLRLGQYERVTKLAQHGITLLRPLKENKGIVLGLNALGAVAGSTGSYTQAKPYFQEALALADAQKDHRSAAVCLDNLASIEKRLGNYSHAKQYYRKSIHLSRKIGDHSQLVMTLNNLGTLILNMDRPEEARPLLQEGLQLAKRVGMYRLVPFFLVNLGLLLYKLGAYKEAQPLYLEALNLTQKNGEAWLEAGLLAELGRVETALKTYSKAQTYFIQSLKAARENQNLPLMLHTIVYVAELCIKQDKNKQATNLLKLALEHQATEQEDKDLAQQLLEHPKDHIPPETMTEALEWSKTANLEEVVEDLLHQLEAETPSESSAR